MHPVLTTLGLLQLSTWVSEPVKKLRSLCVAVELADGFATGSAARLCSPRCLLPSAFPSGAACLWQSFI